MRPTGVRTADQVVPVLAANVHNPGPGTASSERSIDRRSAATSTTEWSRTVMLDALPQSE
jgi:hypothetical protein